MENKKETPIEIYNRGKRIVDLIEQYSAFIPMAKDEDKQTLKDKIVMLNGAKDKIKDELYEKAKEESELDYSKKDKNPDFLRKQYNDKIAEIKSKKHELKLEKIRIKKENEQKKSQMEEQYIFAKDMYMSMLQKGKITKEVYDSKINSIKAAKIKSVTVLGDKLRESLGSIDEESDKLSLQIDDLKGKLDEIEKKEIIYNEYGDVYYRLFGEVLSDRNKLDIPKENVKQAAKKESEDINSNNNVTSENSDNTKAGVEATVSENTNANVETTPNSNVNNSQNINEESEPQIKEENEPDVVVTSRTMFNDLYKKLKKGTITDKELNALAETLSNPDNYDKYGITTGIVFNKARKILKLQGAKTAKNIEKFLRENNVFNSSIKFDASIEKNGILSHDILNSWKNIDEKLTYTDSKFSVEKYIEKIEKYKEAGNELTKEQEAMYNKARDIKNSLSSYRKAINTNYDVTASRDQRDRNSIFFIVFKDRQKSKANRALPEKASRENYPGYIVMDRASGIDLKNLTNSEPTAEEIKPKTSSPRDKSIGKGAR